MGRKWRHGVGAGFKGLLVYAVMGIGGKRRALAGFEIHEVVAHRSVVAHFAAAERFPRIMGLAQKRQIHAEAAIGSLGARDRLKDQVHGRPRRKGLHLRGDVGQNATLHRYLETLVQVIDQAQQPGGHGDIVAAGVDANYGIAGTEEQPIENGSGNADRIVGGMIGLKARTEPAGQANGGAKARDDADFAGGENQVLHPHQLADGSRHLRRKAGGERGQPL